MDTSIKEIDKDIIVHELSKGSNQLVLIDSDTIDTKNFSRIINEHLATYKQTRDDLYLINAAQAYFTLREKSRKKKRAKINDLVILKRRPTCGADRDLRQSFRRIIRFLFKNMEADEDSNELFADRIKQSLFTTSMLRNNTKKIIEKLECLIKNDDELSPEIKSVIEQAKEKIEHAKTKEELIEALAIILSLFEIGIKIIDIIQT